MPSFFDLIAPLYDALRPGSRRVFDAIDRLVELRATDVVVDVGGGTGSIARFFVGRVREIHVVDPSEKMIARCRRRAGVSCVVGGGECLPFADGSVDVAILVDAFHHIPDQAATIREIRRVLRPGGSAVIAEFDPGTLGGTLIVLLEKLLRLGSVFHPPSRLAALFADQGFSVRVARDGSKDYYLVATIAVA